MRKMPKMLLMNSMEQPLMGKKSKLNYLNPVAVEVVIVTAGMVEDVTEEEAVVLVTAEEAEIVTADMGVDETAMEAEAGTMVVAEIVTAGTETEATIVVGMTTELEP